MNKISRLKSPLVAAIIICSSFVAHSEEYPESSQEARTAAVKGKLKAAPATVSLYVRGLCCPSCAIGVRKHISKLKFVDKSRFNKGVDIDPKVQLATVALKDGQAPDPSALALAVDKAGFDPVHLYRLKGRKLQTSPLVVPND